MIEEFSCILAIPYFNSVSDSRNNEYLICLQNNINNPLIDKILLLCETSISLPDSIKSEKIIVRVINHRPTYQDAFKITKYYARKLFNDKRKIIIIANSDIIFTQNSITAINHRLDSNTVLALSRWNIKISQDLQLFEELHNHRDSQDSWAFLNTIKNGNFSFEMGIPGCDNRLAYELHKIKYRVINPAKSIVTKHLHLSDFRTYTYANQKISPPYLLVDLIE